MKEEKTPYQKIGDWPSFIDWSPPNQRSIPLQLVKISNIRF